MFPQISKLRGGRLVVQVYVGGDGPVGRNYIYYASDDHGRNWRHFTHYDDVTEKPASEIALRLSDGEELRGPLETDIVEIDVSGLNLKTYAGFYR
ncbi:MAG: exo-alpha-sialidase [Acidimicrobiia bacterium]|nr:exo-alpha-sialidase [Acidimicrobiia bacterium]